MLDLPPVKQVVADRVSPPHLSPNWGFTVVLKEEVPDTVVINETVRIIDPILTSREMKLRSVQFVVVTQIWRSCKN